MRAKVLALLNTAILVLVAIAICAWVLDGSATFKGCIQQEKHQAADEGSNKHVALFDISPVVYQGCLGDFISANKDELLVGLTGVLAAATILLWQATRALFKSAETTARQQSRAYVFAGQATLEVDPERGPLVKVLVKNTGQTPAYKLTNASAAKTFFGKEVRSFPPPKLSERSSRIDLGPDAVATITIPVGEILNERGLAALRTGEIELYVFGVVNYRDAFGCKQRTTWRFMMGGFHKWPSDGAMVVTKDGNRAT